MPEISELLKIDVERAVGFKIKSTTEAKNLHKLLIEKTNSSVSLSTIRRLWKLIPSRKPNQKTLDELAKFIDFKSFLDYNKHKSRNSNWFDILTLNDLKFKMTLSKTDMDSLTSYFLTHQSPIFHVNLIEQAILNQKWQVVLDIFDPEKNELLIQKDRISEFSAKIANLTCEFLYHLPKEKFREAIEVLGHKPNFKNYCIYVYIDVLGLNKKYGAILKEVRNIELSEEEKIFHDLIGGLHLYLDTELLPQTNLVASSKTREIPTVLLGRYFGYQILYLSQNNSQKEEEEIWYEYLDIISETDNKRDLLHEFTIHMVLGKRMNKLEVLLEKFHDEIFDDKNYHNYLDQFLFNLMDVIVSIHQNDLKRAVRVFSSLSVKQFFENSYCDYYLIFYYLVGSNLPLSEDQLESHKLNYHGLAQHSGFHLFSEEYRMGYFSILKNHKQ